MLGERELRSNEGTRFTNETHIKLQPDNKELKGEWAIIAARESREEAERIAKTAEVASHESGHVVSPVEEVKTPEQVLLEEIGENGVAVLIMRNKETLDNITTLKEAA